MGVENQIARIEGAVDEQAALIAQIQAGLEGKAADNTPEVEQATPSISFSSTGLITATATQEAGKVEAGTKSSTKQLSVLGAQTYTPGTVDQTISRGWYLTGAQTIKGDLNLLAGNIKKGVSVFGVTGSYEGGGSSGGVGVSTCTVTINTDASLIESDFSMQDGNVYGCYYTKLVDGELIAVSSGSVSSGNSLVLTDVALGSLFILYAYLDSRNVIGDYTEYFTVWDGGFTGRYSVFSFGSDITLNVGCAG